MKHIITILLIGISFFSLSIDKEEFEKYKNKYKGETAVILNHEQSVKIGFNKKSGELELFRTDVEDMLYLNESSRFYTSRAIALSEYFQDITAVNVVVIKPNGKKIKLKPDDFSIVDSSPSSWVFHDDDQDLSFSLKELGAGYRSIITYTKKLKKPEFFGVFRMMNMYPVENQLLTINYNKDVKLDFSEINLESYKVVKKETEEKGVITKTWQIEDVESFSYEEGSLGVDYYLPQVTSRILSYKLNGEEIKLMAGVDELHAINLISSPFNL